MMKRENVEDTKEPQVMSQNDDDAEVSPVFFVKELLNPYRMVNIRACTLCSYQRPVEWEIFDLTTTETERPRPHSLVCGQCKDLYKNVWKCYTAEKIDPNSGPRFFKKSM